MLAGFNTGHEGGCGTLHANSATAVPDRIAALGLAAGMTLPGITAQLTAGLEVVIHLARTPRGGGWWPQSAWWLGRDGAAVVEPALVHRGGSGCGGLLLRGWRSVWAGCPRAEPPERGPGTGAPPGGGVEVPGGRAGRSGCRVEARGEGKRSGSGGGSVDPDGGDRGAASQQACGRRRGGCDAARGTSATAGRGCQPAR